MLRVLMRRMATLLLVALVVLVAAGFATTVGPSGSVESATSTTSTTAFTDPTVPEHRIPRSQAAPLETPSVATAPSGAAPASDTPAASSTTTTVSAGSSSPTTTTTVAQPASPTSGMYLWDTAWQIAAKATSDGMDEYVGRLAAVSGSGGANVTGFLFSVVNINQDINTPNGFGHTFGSFTAPSQEYLNDVETLIAKAASRGLRVGIVVAWDGPNQFSVENGRLTTDNAYQYGYTIASQWTRPDFGARWAVSAWVLGGDTTNDAGGEHGAVWSEVARGIKDAEADNGFWGAPILFHTAPGQHLHYLGASWLDAHSPQTGHCADTGTAVAWMNELAATGARVWGNAEARYEDIAWNCNGGVPISPDQVLADAIAMGDLGFTANFVYGHDDRWNSPSPGAHGLSAGGGTAPGLQRILDEPGLIRPRS